MTIACDLTTFVSQRLLARNELFQSFFSREAKRLSEACNEMSERFLSGGRLLAFGRGPYATDAQHVSVEFVHPVIVGKRALPALDLSILFQPWLEAIVCHNDIVIGFGPPDGDSEMWEALSSAEKKGAMTFALPGLKGSYAVETGVSDPFAHQELI
jgi:D-sedoheptulose 7-phosphate isomerase